MMLRSMLTAFINHAALRTFTQKKTSLIPRSGPIHELGATGESCLLTAEASRS
jgi:hypothetical protein